MSTYLEEQVEDLLQDAVAVTEEGGSAPSHRCYVGNLSWGTDAAALRDHVEGILGQGSIKLATVFTERSGRSKGCGVIEFTSAEFAQQAIREVTDTELDNRPIFVREDREPARPPTTGGRQLFVRNLPYHVSWQELKDHFRAAGVGEVLRADIMRNRDNTSKGVGTVLMATEEGAEAAIAALDNTDLGGRSIAVQLDKYA